MKLRQSHNGKVKMRNDVEFEWPNIKCFSNIWRDLFAESSMQIGYLSMYGDLHKMCVQIYREYARVIVSHINVY